MVSISFQAWAYSQSLVGWWPMLVLMSCLFLMMLSKSGVWVVSMAVIALCAAFVLVSTRVRRSAAGDWQRVRVAHACWMSRGLSDVGMMVKSVWVRAACSPSPVGAASMISMMLGSDLCLRLVGLAGVMWKGRGWCSWFAMAAHSVADPWGSASNTTTCLSWSVAAWAK